MMKRIILLISFSICSLISIAQTKIDSSKIIHETYQVDTKAQYKGGLNNMYMFIAQNLEYPISAIEANAQGTVKVSFVVERNGSITNVRILGNERVGFGCEEAAIKVVKQMDEKWEPAVIRGHPVRMRFLLPIRFQLEEDTKRKKRRRKKSK